LSDLLPTVDDPARVIVGDSLTALRTLPDGCVHCCVTSPPYWSLRDYKTEPQVWGGDPTHKHRWQKRRYYREGGGGTSSREAFSKPGAANAARLKAARWKADGICSCGAWRGELGQEPTPDLYVEHMVELFREVRRVLHPTGVLWLNLGDSYSSGGRSTRDPGQSKLHRAFTGEHNSTTRNRPDTPPGLKNKDLIGVPWRVAFALQADGWYLRSFCPWIKRNGMVESITDRPTNMLESVFLLSKSERYYYDRTAVMVASAPATASRLDQNVSAQAGSDRANGGGKTNGSMRAVGSPESRNRRNTDWFFESWQGLYGDENGDPLAFVVNPVPSDFKHFAMWPPMLVEPMIRAGSSEKGVCPACLAPWRRLVERDRKPTRPGEAVKYLPKSDGDLESAEANGWNRPNSIGNRDPQRHVTEVRTVGWGPSCTCGAPPELQAGDMEIIYTPTGEAPEGYDPRATGCPRPRRPTGGGKNERPRADDEGTRPITRYERRKYAEQLRGLPTKVQDALRQEVGADAFAHYRKPGDASGRPIPPDVLERWIEAGHLGRVEVPTWEPSPPIPSLVLDLFAGTGTTVAEAVKLKRRGLGIELNPEYAKQAETRLKEPMGVGSMFDTGKPVVLSLFDHLEPA
jgi:DNA modification methylase